MPIRMKGSEPLPGAEDKRCYQIDVQEGSRRIRISTGTLDPTLARTKEQAVLDALRNNYEITRADLVALVRVSNRRAHSASPKELHGMTLKEACNAALSDPLPWGRSRKAWVNSPSLATYRAQLRDIQRILGARTQVAQIGQSAVSAVIDDLLGPDPQTGQPRNSPATVNRKMFALLSVLRRLQERGCGAPKLPKFVPFDESSNIRSFVFTPEQERELFAALLSLDVIPDAELGGHPRKRDAGDYLDLFTLLADTGCRLSAALDIRWGDIFEENAITFVRFFRAKHLKRGKPRTIPLTNRAAEAVRRQKLNGEIGPFVALRKRRAQFLWTTAKTQTSLAHEPQAVIHSLRHTCATRLLRTSGNIKLVQEWLGHSTLETTSSIYAKVQVDHMVDAMQTFDDRWGRVSTKG